MSKKLLCSMLFAMVIMAGTVRADSLSGLAEVTVVDGAIVSLRYEGTEYVVANGDLLLGATTRWYVADDVETLWVEGDPAPAATVSGTSSPKDGDVGSKADNFNLTLDGSPNISSIDGIDFQETVFAAPTDTIFLLERGGNDTGTWQAILEDGSLGDEVAFDKASDGGPYADTGAKSTSQGAYGVVFTTDVPVIGVRITASGHDTLSISTPAPDLTAKDPNPADDAIGISHAPVLDIYVSDDVPKDIQDLQPTTPKNTLGKTTSLLAIANSTTITDLNVELDIRMPGNNADLNVFLTSPDGKKVELFTDVGFNLDDFKNTVLDDEASKSIRAGTEPFTGTFKPEGKLSDFDGRDTAGDWVLKIEDDWPGDTGTLNSWKLVVESLNVISWVPGADVASQNLYISTNFADVNDSTDAAFQGNLAADVSTFRIDLELDQTYYWRIDSLDADGELVNVGDIWTFATAPEPIFVDPSSDIAAANEGAKPGGLFEFAEGTYVLTSQIEVKDGVTYVGAGPGLTIIDGNDVTRAFAAWGDRGATNGQVDADGAGMPNLTGPTRWVIEG
ncbi:MAG: proprotein convertase P-domain-containing protein, partial [Planctomycetota bacterium]